MEQLPTAEKLIFEILSNVKCDNEIEFLQLTEDGKEILSYLVEEVNNRTKSYVQAALKAASENVELDYWKGDCQLCGSNTIDKESILKAYPLTNIK